ncbi:uncharacterized protein MAM_02559 [Metarhizium album ARSEF 1941]|uniref:Uncharacterized protein n=1 Tax=Metarhizium album (strain ARSEF 1941) TaxID=1081103 RepID=A0A0B2WUF3_METAS|nr:uncharacterized protein MAM_02559 [Metarhizium album ARSEF 1941]KHN99706.1 hypothetical protein MAM_02559 [Metarhizium album ARSEF 1941]
MSTWQLSTSRPRAASRAFGGSHRRVELSGLEVVGSRMRAMQQHAAMTRLVFLGEEANRGSSSHTGCISAAQHASAPRSSERDAPRTLRLPDALAVQAKEDGERNKRRGKVAIHSHIGKVPDTHWAPDAVGEVRDAAAASVMMIDDGGGNRSCGTEARSGQVTRG